MKTVTKHPARRRSVSPTHIRQLRQRLSTDPERPLSQQRFSHLLGVSWSTVARWEGGGRPDPFMEKKVGRLDRLVEALRDMVRPEHRIAFLEQKHPLLMNLRPIDLLDTDEGAEAVLRMVEGASTGAFA